MHKKQYQKKDLHDSSAADRSFIVDDTVYLRSTVGGELVVRHTGPVSYVVREREILTQYTIATEISCRLVSQLIHTDSQVDQLGGKDSGGLQDIVVSTIQSPQPLEPETVPLRRST